MANVNIVCDRCHREIEGIEGEYDGIRYTGGFYRGPGWAKYMNEGEKTVCDYCMHLDPRYLADYPNASPDIRAVNLTLVNKTIN